MQPVYAMVLADTHLLGSHTGHWLDRWRREGQMQSAFQAAMTLHRPDVVFVLGKDFIYLSCDHLIFGTEVNGTVLFIYISI